MGFTLRGFAPVTGAVDSFEPRGLLGVTHATPWCFATPLQGLLHRQGPAHSARFSRVSSYGCPLGFFPSEVCRLLRRTRRSSLIPSRALSRCSQVNTPPTPQGFHRSRLSRCLATATNLFGFLHLVSHLASSFAAGCWVMDSPRQPCASPRMSTASSHPSAPCRSSPR
jgi:hypothetical protein